jgi:hypothetical protein
MAFHHVYSVERSDNVKLHKYCHLIARIESLLDQWYCVTALHCDVIDVSLVYRDTQPSARLLYQHN